jgi:hypothetical protein
MGAELHRYDIIQIVPTHKWGGCLAVVDEPKSWGCQAYVSIPSNDGTPPGQAYIRLQCGEYEVTGARVWFTPQGGE